MQVRLRAFAALVDVIAALEAVEAHFARHACGSFLAMRWAKVKPEAGVALKPP